jgi:hypothetical protein
VAAQFAAEGRAAPLLLPLDVTDRARWAEVVAQTVAHFGAACADQQCRGERVWQCR